MPISIYIPGSSGVTPTGDATESDVRATKGFSSAGGVGKTGTIVTRAAAPQTITPGTTDQVLASGIYDGAITVSGDNDLLPGNIVSGVNVFGVVGSAVVGTNPTGEATPADVKSGVGFSSAASGVNQTGTATVDATKVLAGTTILGTGGTMVNRASLSFNPSVNSQTIPAGFYNGSGTVAPVVGTATAADVAIGKTFSSVVGGVGTTGTAVIGSVGYTAGVTIPTNHELTGFDSAGNSYYINHSVTPNTGRVYNSAMTLIQTITITSYNVFGVSKQGYVTRGATAGHFLVYNLAGTLLYDVNMTSTMYADFTTIAACVFNGTNLMHWNTNDNRVYIINTSGTILTYNQMQASQSPYYGVNRVNNFIIGVMYSSSLLYLIRYVGTVMTQLTFANYPQYHLMDSLDF